MGANLVKRAIAFGAVNHLTGNEFRVLVQMSVTALDTDRPPRYWSSREETARAIGRMLPDEPESGHPDFARICREREAGFSAVKEAIKGLRHKGALRSAQVGRRGYRAAYELTMNGDLAAGDPPPVEEGKPAPTREGFPPPNGRENVPLTVGNPSPLGTVRIQKDEKQESTHLSAPPHLTTTHETDPELNIEPRCDEHVGSPWAARCAACEAAAEPPELVACDKHIHLLPCPKCTPQVVAA
jgi:hypothetical protein